MASRSRPTRTASKVVDVWTGIADDTTGSKVDADTVFPVFSVSKAITATALHIQAERGLVDYYEPIARYWPEFAAHGKGKATVYDALTHRVGVPLLPWRLPSSECAIGTGWSSRSPT